MVDTLTYVGEVTIGAAIPGVNGALLAAMADLNARLAALIAFQATVSLDLTAQINLAATISAALSAALQPPSLSVQINLVTALIAQLQLQLQVIVDLFSLFANGGLHVYAYTGRADGLGPKVTTALTAGLPGGAAGDFTTALVLATTVGATAGAMPLVFKMSP
jgi:hypothetical protein